MITALDTNVILDILIPGAPRGTESERAMSEALRAGAVVINEAVYAELAAHFADQDTLDLFLDDTGLRLDSSSAVTLYRAGRAWSEYARRRPESVCPECGAKVQRRQHVVADFMIGAHALMQADRLLTRDRGYYATYFPELTLA